MAGFFRTNQEWITQLSTSGEAQAQALANLHPLLLRSVQHTCAKYPSTSQDQARVHAQAEDCAQDALITLLAYIDASIVGATDW